MKIEIGETIFIVTGSELVPEEKDRPLAYQLKQQIDAQGMTPYHRAIVVTDLWYLENQLFHISPVVVVGGPGVNRAAVHLLKQVPVLWSDGEHAFMQMTKSDSSAKALLWGMNQQGTEKALHIFLEESYLSQFLQDSWRKFA